MEIVSELTEEHLSDLEIPLGHRIKFMKRVKELAVNPPQAPPVQRQTEIVVSSSTATETEPEETIVEDTPPVDDTSYGMFKEALSEFSID
jgi:hypothetical protein